MALPFDHITNPRDHIHAHHSAFAHWQRKIVWNYIHAVLPELHGFEMMELNYGYGEDLDLFGERGFNLIATDIGAEMMKVTNRNSQQVSMQNQISSHYLDFDNLNENLFDKRFDLVFSNFGGINRVSPDALKKMFQTLPQILKPGGRFIGVVMPKFCAWETMFFILRLQFRKAFRRLTNRELITHQNGTDLSTWFYNPSELTRWSKENFKLVTLKPVGLTVPPVHLERFISFRKNWLQRMATIEKKISQSSLFSGMSDNFIVDLQLR